MPELSKVQMGLESVAGTLVAATKMLDIEGGAELELLDEVRLPRYVNGIAQPTMQNAFMGGTASRLTVKDTPCSFQLLAYLCNMAIKAVVGPATAFDFPLPTTTPNSISTFTFEAVMARILQEYEFGYGFISKMGFAADAEADGGVAKVNYVVEGRKSAASTVTGSLAFIPSREMMNLRTASFKIDALGTAAGTTAATANALRAFSIDFDTGWVPESYADSRSDKDWSIARFNPEKMKLTGKMRIYKGSTAVTQIANARAGTGIVVQVDFIGTSTLDCKFKLPLLWLSAPKDDTGGDSLEFDFEAGYDSAGSTQGASVNITLASTTIA